MNKKLLAIAVAGAVATPVVAQAQLEFYGRIGNEIQYDDRSWDSPNSVVFNADGSVDVTVDDPDRKDTKTTNVDTFSSRLGLRYNQSVGNGMAVHGRYEFEVVSDREESGDGDAIDDVRIASVGVSGAFGRVDVGNMWSAYYNKIGANIDSMGMIYDTIGQGPFRSSNTIKYSNVFGPVDFEIDVRLLDDENADSGNSEGSGQAEGLTDGFGVGVSFSPVAGFSVSAAYDEEAKRKDSTYPVAERGRTVDEGYDITRWGVAGSYNFGVLTFSAGWQNVEDDDPDVEDTDSYFLSASGSFDEQTSWLVGYAEGESITPFSVADAGVAGGAAGGMSNEDSDQLFVRVARKLGGGLSVGYEGSFETSGGIDGTHNTSTTGGAPLANAVVGNNGYEVNRHRVYMQVDF